MAQTETKIPVDPFARGPCVCLTCKHEWTGEWRIGSGPIECPQYNCKSTRTRREMKEFPVEQTPPVQYPYDEYYGE